MEGYVISLIGLLCKQGVCSHLLYFISLLFKEGIFMERIAFQEWGGFLWFCEGLRISSWGGVAGHLCTAGSCLSCAHRSIRALAEEEAGGVLSAPAPLKPGGRQEGQTRAEGPGRASWAEGVRRIPVLLRQGEAERWCTSELSQGQLREQERGMEGGIWGKRPAREGGAEACRETGGPGGTWMEKRKWQE